MLFLDISAPPRSFDLEQALLALRDLVLQAPPNTDPAFVSARQQARMVLRRHKVEHDGDSRRPDEHDPLD